MNKVEIKITVVVVTRCMTMGGLYLPSSFASQFDAMAGSLALPSLLDPQMERRGRDSLWGGGD